MVLSLSAEVYFFCCCVDSRGSIKGGRLDGGYTVPGDRVLIMLMSITVGKGLYRLLCVPGEE